MKKTFTVELIAAITEATARMISSMAGAGKNKEEVEGEALFVSVYETNQMGFNGTTSRKASIAYGRMVIAHGLDISLINQNGPGNMLSAILTNVVGASRDRVDMNRLVAMISSQTVAQAMNSSQQMGYLSVAPSCDFKVDLPGDVQFARMDKTISVTKNGECVYMVLSTLPHVVEQHINQAAQLALSQADDLIYPAREVDVSVDSAILNGVLYVKSDDNKVAYYFDDERTKSSTNRHQGFGINQDAFMSNLNMNQGYNFNPGQPMRPGTNFNRF